MPSQRVVRSRRIGDGACGVVEFRLKAPNTEADRERAAAQAGSGALCSECHAALLAHYREMAWVPPPPCCTSCTRPVHPLNPLLRAIRAADLNKAERQRVA